MSVQEPVQAIDLHAFCDASASGTAVAVYAVVYQESRTSQGLLTAKAQLSKKGLTIPRLELVSTHMAANLVNNVRNTLEGYAVRSMYGWTGSMVALHWISGQRNYKKIVSNRAALINAKNFINWKHVRTDQNPADVGNRGTESKELLEIWLKGPDWLSTPDVWPALPRRPQVCRLHNPPQKTIASGCLMLTFDLSLTKKINSVLWLLALNLISLLVQSLEFDPIYE